MYPLKLVSEVIFLKMTPLTRPASEFHLTWSPTLNLFDIAVFQINCKTGRHPRIAMLLSFGIDAGDVSLRHRDRCFRLRSALAPPQILAPASDSILRGSVNVRSSFPHWHS